MRSIPFHPVLVAVFLVVYLWAQNAEEADPSEVWPVLGTVGVGAALLVALLWLVLRDLGRAGLVASIAAFLLLAYGRLWPASLSPWVGLGVTGAVVIAAAVVARRVSEDRVGSWTSTANVGAVMLVVLSFVPVVLASSGAEVPAATGADPVVSAPEDPRDIYYVILDRYGRDDTLADVFDLDNSAFTSELERRGFDVAERSVANYPKTAHSLATSLNLDYLDDLEASVPDDAQDSWAPVYGLLRDHTLGRVLTGVGYEYVHLGTWWSPTQTAESADVTLTLDHTSEFERVFTDTTAWAAVQRLTSEATLDKRVWKREHTRFQLDELERLADAPSSSPRFVFAHLTLPHEPYVFEADGSFVSEATERSRTREDNYRRQIAYANERILGWLDGLVSGDDATDPIVIVQADEGPHPAARVARGPAYRWTEAPDAELREKLRILNAVRLPGVADDEIPETTTPVNTFRFILSRYFGADLPPLEDRAFVFPDERHLYEFSEVTDRVQ